MHGEHIEILKAIESGGGDDAERVMRQHIAAARLVVEKRLVDEGLPSNWVTRSGRQPSRGGH